MTPCFIGAGANLGEPVETLRWARRQLASLPGASNLQASSLYRSAAIGPGEQSDYLNAVLSMDSTLAPEVLLQALQTLENDAGRVRRERWGPRTLDLDLLLYGDLYWDSATLTLPHPRIFERNFVLQPLAELVTPKFRFPDGSALSERLAQCPDNPLQRTALPWEPPAVPRERRA